MLPSHKGPGSSGVSFYREYTPGAPRPLSVDEINALVADGAHGQAPDNGMPAAVQDALNCPPGPSAPPNPPRLWSRAQEDCASCEGGPCYNSSQLAERRKYEILQYKNPSLGTTKKEAWTRAVRGRGRYGRRQWATQGIVPGAAADEAFPKWNIRPDCLELQPDGRSLRVRQTRSARQCWSVDKSDVPPSITGTRELCRVPQVPLTRYRTRRYFSAGGTKWPQYSWAPGMRGFPRGKAGQAG